ncbi:stage V sporulation protein AC [Salimicrobium halophilum]|uniref:Stage V sporulation protein AC n=2 Tax=Salimicrobium halophilum TaxID=86666 RepID=A0A1G8PZB3_9BACI|nr:stage V sporulation protein AC [Salimicrobium halophilum]
MKKEDYEQLVNKTVQPPAYFMNMAKAFLVGGLICVFGEGLMNMYTSWLGFSREEAGDPMVATLIFISALLTGFGLYDRLAQFAGAGTSVPVTGFSNSLTSAAMEHKSEGFVLGVATNMFKLAGSVIVFGVVAAYILGVLRYVLVEMIPWG